MRVLRMDALARAVALAVVPMASLAQTVPLAFAVDGSLTASDNGGWSAPGQERQEFITSVRPRMTMARHGADLDLDLQAAANVLAYAKGTQRGGVLPDARASIKATLAERLLYVDAAARVRQSEADPFGAREDDMTGINRRTEGAYQLSPYIEREFSPGASLLARHTESLTTNAAGTGTRFVSRRSLIQLERKPAPLGAAVELSKSEGESQGYGNSRFTLDAARLRTSLQLEGGVVIEVVAGEERSRLLLSDRSDPLYGLALRWKPGPRTELSVGVEHRFFGQGGTLVFRHRLPFMSFELAASREPVTASASLGVLREGADIRSFLDAILTTRYPDPAVRGGVVDAVVTSRGLDGELRGPIDVVAEYPQLQTSARATGVLLGTRNTVSLTLYTLSRRQLIRPGDPLLVIAVAGADSRQTGGSFQFSRRLAPQVSADAAVRWSRFTGLALRAGDFSEEQTYRLSLMRHLSMRTDASVGVQHDLFTTTVSGQHSYAATQVFLGMSHRF